MRKAAKAIVSASIIASIVISALSKWDVVIATTGKTAILSFMFLLGICTLYVLFTPSGQSKEKI